MAKEPEFLVSTVRQMEALASPVRHHIHLAMEMLGECSVNELAERMGRVPETLYYHLRQLKKVGIVEQVGSRVPFCFWKTPLETGVRTDGSVLHLVLPDLNPQS